MGSKNIGQVAGMYVSTTPPENTKMIWWDSTPSQLCHKIYDSNLKQWVILNQGILSTITYNELKNLALSVGLSVGKFYVVTDKGNILALSITRTKVQYVDLSGNLLVDDLGSNTTYYVSSNNLTIDGENGVFNQDSTKLNFNFTEAVPNIDTAYIYGKDRTSSSSSVMRLIKFKLNSLISTATGNAISWNSGLYFNFNETLLTLGDKKGGVVLFDTYSKDKEIQDQSIENIANNYNALVSQVNSLISEATSDTNILNKRITALQTGGEPIDAAAGDTIYTVLSKFQRYINKFKYATGIRLSQKFSSISSSGKVNNNDTVETAIAKLQNSQSNIKLSLPTDWVPNSQTNQKLDAGESYDSAFGKIEADRRKIIDLETPWTSLTVRVNEGTTSDLEFRIFNGTLEIRNLNWIKIEWIYTRTVVNDYTRFHVLGFSDEILSKILDYIQIPSSGGDYSGTKCLILSTICQTCQSKAVIDSESGGWVNPNKIVLASVNLGYTNSGVGGEWDGRYLGIALAPVASSTVADGAISSEEINGETTFQNICSGTNIRFYIPPFNLRYKLL